MSETVFVLWNVTAPSGEKLNNGRYIGRDRNDGVICIAFNKLQRELQISKSGRYKLWNKQLTSSRGGSVLMEEGCKKELSISTCKARYLTWQGEHRMISSALVVCQRAA